MTRETKRPNVVAALGSRTPEVASALRQCGLSVGEARTGLAVVSLLFPRHDGRARQPDALVLSAVLPGYNGLSVLAGIRSLGWRTPVVMTFPAKPEWMFNEAGRLSCDRLLQDPVGTEHVCAAVLSCLGLSNSDEPGALVLDGAFKGQAGA